MNTAHKKDQWSSADLTGRFPAHPGGYPPGVHPPHSSQISHLSLLCLCLCLRSFFLQSSLPAPHSPPNCLITKLPLTSPSSSKILSSLTNTLPPTTTVSFPGSVEFAPPKTMAYVISVLSSCYASFSSNRWPDLLPLMVNGAHPQPPRFLSAQPLTLCLAWSA